MPGVKLCCPPSGAVQFHLLPFARLSSFPSPPGPIPLEAADNVAKRPIQDREPHGARGLGLHMGLLLPALQISITSGPVLQPHGGSYSKILMKAGHDWGMGPLATATDILSEQILPTLMACESQVS